MKNPNAESQYQSLRMSVKAESGDLRISWIHISPAAEHIKCWKWDILRICEKDELTSEFDGSEDVLRVAIQPMDCWKSERS